MKMSDALLVGTGVGVGSVVCSTRLAHAQAALMPFVLIGLCFAAWVTFVA